ncbi:MAG: ATP-binding protein [Thermodesulfobacteriota bacterium]
MLCRTLLKKLSGIRKKPDSSVHHFNPQLLLSLVDKINDSLFILDPTTGRILFANNKATESLGYACGDLSQMSILDIEEELPDIATWHDHIALVRKDHPGVFPGTRRRKDGTTFPVEVHISHTSVDGQEFVVCVARDISERKGFETELIEERNKLTSVLDAMGDGLTVQDRNFKILYQNNIHKEKFNDRTGEYCYQAYHGRDAVCDGCLLKKTFRDGKVHKRETLAETESGTLHMEVSSSPVHNAAGKIVAGVETVRDITPRIKLEKQFLQAQKMEAIGRLTGGIAHDFNNLLSIILGYSDLIMLGLSKENPMYENIQIINESGQKAAQMTRQLLAFSRKQPMEIANVELNPLLEEVAKILKSTLGDDVDLKMDLHPELPLFSADKHQLEQVIMNLAINARDAMADGGDILIDTSTFEMGEEFVKNNDGSRAGSYIQLRVTDSGTGIDPEHRNLIFEPFFTTKEEGKGTGLGLSTVYGIVKQHNGYIKLESTLGKGTTFRVFLPLAESAVADLQKSRPDAAVAGSETLLIVDDEPTIRKMLKDIISPHGYQILEAGSGEEALELCDNQAQGIDLMLTDVVMKGMNGKQLAEKMATVRPATQILYMSGYTEDIISDKGIVAPGTKLIAKPFSPVELLTRVRAVLDSREVC